MNPVSCSGESGEAVLIEDGSGARLRWPSAFVQEMRMGRSGTVPGGMRSGPKVAVYFSGDKPYNASIKT